MTNHRQQVSTCPLIIRSLTLTACSIAESLRFDDPSDDCTEHVHSGIAHVTSHRHERVLNKAKVAMRQHEKPCMLLTYEYSSPSILQWKVFQKEAAHEQHEDRQDNLHARRWVA